MSLNKIFTLSITIIAAPILLAEGSSENIAAPPTTVVIAPPVVTTPPRRLDRPAMPEAAPRGTKLPSLSR